MSLFNDKFLFDYGKDKRILIVEREDGLFNITLIDDKNGPPQTLGTSDLFVFFKKSIEMMDKYIEENGITYTPEKD